MAIKDLSNEEIIERLKALKNEDDPYSKEERLYCEELYHRYYFRVYKFCRYYGLRHNDAEDVSQDVFIKLFNNVRGFKRNKEFEPWFFKLALNKIKDKYKRDIYKKPLDISDYDQISSAGENNIFENFQIRAYIESITKKIPEKYRQVLLLKVYEDLDYEMIAEITGITSRQVRNRLETAFQLFKKAAEQDYE